MSWRSRFAKGFGNEYLGYETVFGGCHHSGRPLVGDGSCWAKMAEAASLVVGIDALGGGTVSGDVGDVERSSADPCVRSARSPHVKMPWSVANSIPGRKSGPARPAECTARPSACAVRMVSKTSAAVAHSRPGDGSTVAHLEARPRLEPTLGWAGKCDR